MLYHLYFLSFYHLYFLFQEGNAIKNDKGKRKCGYSGLPIAYIIQDYLAFFSISTGKNLNSLDDKQPKIIMINGEIQV